LHRGKDPKKGFVILRSVERKATARILDGTDLARRLREEARAQAADLPGPPPGLRVILVGGDPASEAYVSSKTKAMREAGLRAETIRLPPDAAPQTLLGEIDRANQSADIDGILVQLPLPPGHDPRRIFDALDPRKDVDGFHPENVGLLHQGRPVFVPCTPAGILALLDDYAIPIAGRRAVVIGRSEIVGRPVAALLTSRDATVTLCHSKTRDLPAICREAEIVIAAIGRAGLVTEEFVREGAAVIDVGINRLTEIDALPPHLRTCERLRQAIQERGKVLVGDVDFDRVAPVAGWITPVPGGVGPLTVAMLLKNTVLAARLRASRGAGPL
jgi:methylenetetrahydrofolate dehydrogenase (NADP+)/methenyltetrahydrofolate cyclohydrolase